MLIIAISIGRSMKQLTERIFWDFLPLVIMIEAHDADMRGAVEMEIANCYYQLDLLKF
jgi:hypothetical protein